METIKTSATAENINKAIDKIKAYAKEKGYEIKSPINPGELPRYYKPITFDSKKQEKTCSNYLDKMQKKMGMRIANTFMHFMHRKVFKFDTEVPRLDYSKRELEIKAAKKEWKEANALAETLLKKYKETKGDFYKKQK